MLLSFVMSSSNFDKTSTACLDEIISDSPALSLRDVVADTLRCAIVSGMA